MRHVPALLGFRSFCVPASLHDAARVDVFARWGGGETSSQKRLDRYARAFGAPRLIIEDGFIRSVQIGLSGTPGLSVIVDDVAPYYDAKQPTRLECFLNSEWALTPGELERCKRLIALIAKHRVSKYNHAPDLEISGVAPGAVLVVDQRVGDQAVVKCLASEAAFREQLVAALHEHPDKQVLVKRHPDALIGGKGSYYTDEALGELRDAPRVHLIDYDVNPHALFDLCSDVYVVSSGMGFEALLRGLTVHCFGVPFYAGWGATSDRIACDRRSHKRSVEEILFASYLVHSRYVHPVRGTLCELEELIPALAELRDHSATSSRETRRADTVVSFAP
jgi:capsule polysaccharide export protein KpsC/LpsZ